ncbi:MAG: DUF4143 domain-containing protein [Acidimicrobiaceae bacterium]|nr:DUF4143 domain-containing protein [Acidimicrobiaceae bacterium]
MVAASGRRPCNRGVIFGLAAALIGVDAAALRPPTATATGPLLETFAVGEIARQLAAGAERVTLYHYRDNARREADLVLERPDGAVVAVEVKATASPRAGDLRHIAAMRDGLDHAEPGAFRVGILLHTGTHALSFGDRLHSAPRLRRSGKRRPSTALTAGAHLSLPAAERGGLGVVPLLVCGERFGLWSGLLVASGVSRCR